AYVASWIEIYAADGTFQWGASRLMWPRGLKYHSFSVLPAQRMSRLMWPRGLKCYSSAIQCKGSRVEAYVASWI
ncbi:hypothetical protein HMPREF1548_06252, partial [Clostridium sp. KLE 1755]